METINSVASNFSNSIWGKTDEPKSEHQEPQSGVQGDTSKGEPFDGGNMERNQEPTDPAANVNPVAMQDSSKETNEAHPAAVQDSSKETSETNPAAVEDSSKETHDSTKAQNDTRDPEDPQTHPADAEPAKNVDDSGEGPNEVNVDGPGPKPIADVAMEHGGDAGNRDSAVELNNDEDNNEADDDGPQKTSHGTGTGEQYVKSSGLKADGGDFDAANPGAGREADRLLEEKGIHHEGGEIVDEDTNSNGNDNGNDNSPERKEKKSLGAKIKAKLHRSSAS